MGHEPCHLLGLLLVLLASHNALASGADPSFCNLDGVTQPACSSKVYNVVGSCKIVPTYVSTLCPDVTVQGLDPNMAVIDLDFYPSKWLLLPGSVLRMRNITLYNAIFNVVFLKPADTATRSAPSWNVTFINQSPNSKLYMENVVVGVKQTSMQYALQIATMFPSNHSNVSTDGNSWIYVPYWESSTLSIRGVNITHRITSTSNDRVVPVTSGADLIRSIQDEQKLDVPGTIVVTSNITLTSDLFPTGGLGIYRNITVMGAPGKVVGLNLNSLANVFTFLNNDSLFTLNNLRLENLPAADLASLATVQGTASSSMSFAIFPMWSFQFARPLYRQLVLQRCTMVLPTVEVDRLLYLSVLFSSASPLLTKQAQWARDSLTSLEIGHPDNTSVMVEELSSPGFRWDYVVLEQSNSIFKPAQSRSQLFKVVEEPWPVGGAPPMVQIVNSSGDMDRALQCAAQNAPAAGEPSTDCVLIAVGDISWTPAANSSAAAWAASAHDTAADSVAYVINRDTVISGDPDHPVSLDLHGLVNKMHIVPGAALQLKYVVLRNLGQLSAEQQLVLGPSQGSLGTLSLMLWFTGMNRHETVASSGQEPHSLHVTQASLVVPAQEYDYLVEAAGGRTFLLLQLAADRDSEDHSFLQFNDMAVINSTALHVGAVHGLGMYFSNCTIVRGARAGDWVPPEDVWSSSSSGIEPWQAAVIAVSVVLACALLACLGVLLWRQCIKTREARAAAMAGGRKSTELALGSAGPSMHGAGSRSGRHAERGLYCSAGGRSNCDGAQLQTAFTRASKLSLTKDSRPSALTTQLGPSNHPTAGAATSVTPGAAASGSATGGPATPNTTIATGAMAAVTPGDVMSRMQQQLQQMLAEQVRSQCAAADSGHHGSRVGRAPQLELLGMLGEGTYGKVYRGLWQGSVVAVKTMVLPTTISNACKRQKMALMEAAISSSLSHPNIVQTYTYRLLPIRSKFSQHSSREEDENLEGCYSVDLETGRKPISAPVRGGGVAAASRANSKEVADVHGWEIWLVLEYCNKGTLRAALNDNVFWRRQPSYCGTEPDRVVDPCTPAISDPGCVMRELGNLATQLSSRPASMAVRQMSGPSEGGLRGLSCPVRAVSSREHCGAASRCEHPAPPSNGTGAASSRDHVGSSAVPTPPESGPFLQRIASTTSSASSTFTPRSRLPQAGVQPGHCPCSLQPLAELPSGHIEQVDMATTGIGNGAAAASTETGSTAVAATSGAAATAAARDAHNSSCKQASAGVDLGNSASGGVASGECGPQPQVAPLAAVGAGAWRVPRAGGPSTGLRHDYTGMTGASSTEGTAADEDAPVLLPLPLGVDGSMQPLSLVEASLAAGSGSIAVEPVSPWPEMKETVTFMVCEPSNDSSSSSCSSLQRALTGGGNAVTADAAVSVAAASAAQDARPNLPAPGSGVDPQDDACSKNGQQRQQQGTPWAFSAATASASYVGGMGPTTGTSDSGTTPCRASGQPSSMADVGRARLSAGSAGGAAAVYSPGSQAGYPERPLSASRPPEIQPVPEEDEDVGPGGIQAAGARQGILARCMSAGHHKSPSAPDMLAERQRSARQSIMEMQASRAAAPAALPYSEHLRDAQYQRWQQQEAHPAERLEEGVEEAKAEKGGVGELTPGIQAAMALRMRNMSRLSGNILAARAAGGMYHMAVHSPAAAAYSGMAPAPARGSPPFGAAASNTAAAGNKPPAFRPFSAPTDAYPGGSPSLSRATARARGQAWGLDVQVPHTSGAATVHASPVNRSGSRHSRRSSNMPVPHEQLDYEGILDTALDVARAMVHLHSEGIIHSDLKASNILLQESGSSSGRSFVAKVSDFGLSTRIDPGDTHVSNLAQGTLTHMAPEVLISGKLSKASDVYAYGILLWELYTAGRAFQGVPRALLGHEVARNRLRPHFPTTCPLEYQLLACRCWETDASIRPTFEQVYSELSRLRTKLGESGGSPSRPGSRGSSLHRTTSASGLARANNALSLQRRPSLLPAMAMAQPCMQVLEATEGCSSDEGHRPRCADAPAAVGLL